MIPYSLSLYVPGASLHDLNRDAVECEGIPILPPPCSSVRVAFADFSPAGHLCGEVFFCHHVADRDAAPCWIDYQRIARKTPSWENTSFVTHFSAIHWKALTPAARPFVTLITRPGVQASRRVIPRSPRQVPFFPEKVPENTTGDEGNTLTKATLLPHRWSVS